MWSGVEGLISEIKSCQAAGASVAAVAVAFVCIDTMAFLSLPAQRKSQGRADFMAWVATYLKADEAQPYQYRSIDVYGARCALLHAFGSEGDFHQKFPDAKKFGYHDGGTHAHDPTQDDRLVLIGTASFLNDVVRAVGSFLEECNVNQDLRARVEGRLPMVLTTLPVTKAD
jgi:hypothetical protein